LTELRRHCQSIVRPMKAPPAARRRQPGVSFHAHTAHRTLHSRIRSMNRSCLRLLSAVALTTAAVQSAHAADDKESPWSLSAFGGSAVGFTGSLRNPEITSIPDLGTLDPGLAESSGSVTMNNVLYDDIFGHGHDVGLELGYAFSRNLEGFDRVTYEGLAGQTTAIGSLS